MRTLLLRSLTALALLAPVAGCGMDYLLKQGSGQISMLMHREPIDRVLTEPGLAPQMRDRLTLVRDVKAFAERDLGLTRSASYTTLVRLDRDAVSYTVSAAPRDRLEPYLWWFPVVGAVPYKGFFNRADAERERRSLEARGYDVFLRGVSAYSLLGFVADPLYSPMLASPRSELANVIVHELTHGTVFLSGRSSFNEGFATFVGDRGAVLYLQRKYGADSAEAHEAEAELRDQVRFNSAMRTLADELTALYAQDLSRDEKLRNRDALFLRARRRFAQLPFETHEWGGFEHMTLNNAYVMTFATYNGSQARFEVVYDKLGHDLRRFVAFFHDVVAKQHDPEGFLDEIARHPERPLPGTHAQS